MSSNFNPRIFFYRTDKNLIPGLFSSYGETIEFEENVGVKQKANLAFDAYNAMEQGANKNKFTSAMNELHKFADNAKSGGTLQKYLSTFQIVLPDEVEDSSVHNQAVWLFLNRNNHWQSLMMHVSVDGISESQFFKVKVAPPPPEQESDDKANFEKLLTAITSYFYELDGRGKHSDSNLQLLDNGEERYFIYLNDHCSVRTQCQDGEFDFQARDAGAVEIIFIFNCQTRELEAKFPTGLEKRRKIHLCTLWARIMKDSKLEQDNQTAAIHNLSDFLTEGFDFVPDEDGQVVSAFLREICVLKYGFHGSRRIFQESKGDIYECMKKELNLDTMPLEALQVHYVIIRFRLADEFGTSKSQTVKITPEGSDIANKNVKVQDVLRQALVRWGIAAA